MLGDVLVRHLHRQTERAVHQPIRTRNAMRHVGLFVHHRLEPESTTASLCRARSAANASRAWRSAIVSGPRGRSPPRRSASSVGGIVDASARRHGYQSPQPATGSNLPTRPNTKANYTL